MKESYKLVAELNRSRLRALIDEKKVLMSVLYSDALTYSVEHSIKHGGLAPTKSDTNSPLN